MTAFHRPDDLLQPHWCKLRASWQHERPALILKSISWREMLRFMKVLTQIL